MTGCHKPETPPSAQFQSVYADYLHGNLELARSRADQLRRELLATPAQANSDWASKFRLLEADILLRQDRAADAIDLLNARDASPADKGDPAIKSHVLRSLADSKLGRMEDAARELQAARQLAESTHSPLIAEVLRMEGVLIRDQDPDKANEKFKSSLAATRDGGDVLVRAANLIDLGFNNIRSGHFAEAITWFQHAADLARSNQAFRYLEMATGNMGWSYQNLGDFERALAHFQDAEQQAKSLGLASHRTVWLQNAGLAEYRLGDLAKAEEYDQLALSSALALPRDQAIDQIVNIETNLALLLFEQSHYEGARKYADAAVLSAKSSKDDYVVAYTRYIQGLLASRQDTAAAQDMLMSARQLATDPDLRTDVELALAELYRSKERTAEARKWYLQAIQTFEDKRAAVSDEALRLSAFSYGESVYRKYADFLIQTNKPNEALNLLDRSRSRTLEEGLNSTRARSSAADGTLSDPRAAARKLQAVILFYALGPDQSHLWAINAGETRLVDLPSEAEIQSLVRKHQSNILQSGDPVRTPNQATMSLYNALIRPVADMIPPGSRIVLVPDGVLHGLNYETLVVPNAAAPRYWIEDVTITTASSIGILSTPEATKATPSTTKDLLVIGDSIPPPQDFLPLPDAAAEIKRVGQHFAPANEVVLSQNQAVPSAYAASAPEQFRFIHFAAHGTASRLSPLDSAIVLSPTQGDPEDFKLYARDIVQHPLNATLITVSACYGSGVRTYAGEGLVGLAWVFLRAGAHNVIAALWQVSDSASPMLMDRLYDDLQAGKPPDVALRDAKLSLLHSSGIYKKPLFWGAFQLYAGS